YLPEFSVNLNPLTTGTTTKEDDPDMSGLFCPAQQTLGAFGVTDVRTIIQTGVPGGDLSDHAQHAATLAAVFCIPATGNALIDGAADLAGPGSVSLPGMTQLQ